MPRILNLNFEHSDFFNVDGNCRPRGSGVGAEDSCLGQCRGLAPGICVGGGKKRRGLFAGGGKRFSHRQLSVNRGMCGT